MQRFSKSKPKKSQEAERLFLRELVFPVLKRALVKLLDWLFNVYFK
ncbi:hypothetical protein [Sporolactobacillus laevolacticus]|uniref:Uncharacterized protein n=1 Tax=Sporolactobacillus laevolacticus DSM 442 TaxID=1395513 RepID=V6IUZ2_9BACL|nr:hypothetical protein [Sporolactobacillus laevolacticus]EST10251.1 hypothetical protein P343_18275 [Sporolactobacillus laevolacticus DSM 442]